MASGAWATTRCQIAGALTYPKMRLANVQALRNGAASARRGEIARYPIRSPAIAIAFDQLNATTARSMKARVSGVLMPSYVSVRYGSSEITIAGSRTMAFSSRSTSAGQTAPVGLFGEFRGVAFVRGPLPPAV